MRVRKDDTVVLIAGKDKGGSGRVVRADPKRGRVYVEGLNIVKRHQRAGSMKDARKGETGGIIEKEGPIDVSNVMVLDPQDNRPTRIGIRVGSDGKRRRYAKRTGNDLD